MNETKNELGSDVEYENVLNEMRRLLGNPNLTNDDIEKFAVAELARQIEEGIDPREHTKANTEPLVEI